MDLTLWSCQRCGGYTAPQLGRPKKSLADRMMPKKDRVGIAYRETMEAWGGYPTPTRLSTKVWDLCGYTPCRCGRCTFQVHP